MKMKVFSGDWYEAQDAFNKWAKGKSLNKDIIIHTHAEAFYEAGKYSPKLTIVVIHPEDQFWDSTQEEPISRVQPEVVESPRMEREVTA